MKKKTLSLNRLTLNKATITPLAGKEQMGVRGGETAAADTCISSLPFTMVNCPVTLKPMTQPCGTQGCGGTSA
ncbi:class I lanthipeptide [Taibaiella koreensis]|uniref:class I lanthipeptide n=1 Tax=Taibaiella koreensis TaxID=1268548 RepID=UPI000E5A0E43|nr:class I lanthipeptide [Taibaiella koreensis]